MTQFDFGKYFDGSEPAGQTKQEFDPLKEILEGLANSSEDKDKAMKDATAEDLMNAFKAKYGDPNKYVGDKLMNEIKPYAESALDGLMGFTKKNSPNGEKTPITILTIALLDATRHLNAKFLEDNSDEPAILQTLKSAALAQLVNGSLPEEESPTDTMIAIHSLLAVASLKMTQLTVHLQAQEAYREHLDNQ